MTQLQWWVELTSQLFNIQRILQLRAISKSLLSWYNLFSLNINPSKNLLIGWGDANYLIQSNSICILQDCYSWSIYSIVKESRGESLQLKCHFKRFIANVKYFKELNIAGYLHCLFFQCLMMMSHYNISLFLCHS